MGLIVKEVNCIGDFDDLEIQWTALLDECNHLCFFLSWKWLNLWWHTFSLPSDKLKIFIIQEHDAILAIVPFYVQNNKVLRFIGTGEAEEDEVATEYLDIICHKKNSDIIIQELKKYILTSSIKKMLFNNHLENSLINKLLKTIQPLYWHHSIVCGVRYSIDINANESPIETNIDQATLKRLQRAKRSFHNKLNGEILTFNSPEKVLEGFNALVNLHSLRWQSKHQQGVFSSKKFSLFHKSFCQYAAKKQWLKLHVLSANDQYISAIYCLSYQKKTHFYQSGIDDKFKPNVSPGLLMHLFEIENAIKNKEESYDFMKGKLHGSYKEKLSNQRTLMYNTSVLKKTSTNIIGMLKFFIQKQRLKNKNG